MIILRFERRASTSPLVSNNMRSSNMLVLMTLNISAPDSDAPQTADSLNEHQDPGIGANQLSRKAHHLPGPRSSINRGPIQGQPRIFSSMNTGADFQQEPPALRKGQPRIFAGGNGQDSQPWSMNESQSSPSYTRGNQPQQESSTMYNNRTVDAKGKGMDRSRMDPTPGFQRQQQRQERSFDQRDNQVLPQGQTGGSPIRSVYTEAKSPAMQYRATLERGKERNRVSGSGSPDNRSTEPHRPPVRRATEPPPPTPLRQNSAGSNTEPQQRIAGSRGQSADNQQTLNLNGDNVGPMLNRRQTLYSPVVTITVPDTPLLNEPPTPSPKTLRSPSQRSDSAQREQGRYHSPPTPPFNAERSPTTNSYSSGDINGSTQEPPQNRDPRGQSAGWNVQSSTGSLTTQDPSRTASFTSNTSVSSDWERDRSSVVVEPQPAQNRLRKSTQPSRPDNGQTSPPPTHHQSRERTRTNATPTNRGSHMDSFYGGDASFSGMKKPNLKNGDAANHIGVDEEPEPYFYPLELHLLRPQLLRALLQYLTFYDWCVLQGINKNLRSQLSHVKELREEVLERYLSTIGYARWAWEGDEPLPISLRVKSGHLLPMIGLTSTCRISANICAVFRYPHTSTRESQRTTCKHELLPCRKRRGRGIPSKRERCPSPPGHIAESSFDYALKQKLSSPMGASSLNSPMALGRGLALRSEE